MDNWFNVKDNPPKEDGKDVLVYTENGKMRVCNYFKGRWNTYLKVTHWQELPKKPKKEDK